MTKAGVLLTFFSAGVHLRHHLELRDSRRELFIKLRGQLGAVHRVDHVEICHLGERFDLVGLQVPNKVPANVGGELGKGLAQQENKKKRRAL